MRKLRMTVFALSLALSALPAVHAQGRAIVNQIAGQATKAAYQATGHVCASKPWYVPMPDWLWYNLTCAKVAR